MHTHKFFTYLLLLVFVLFFSPAILAADEKPIDIRKTTCTDIFSDIFGHYPLPNLPSGGDISGKKSSLNIPKNWEFSVGMERYIASNTSYEIGLNEPPWTKPLSRLVFPVNTWWMTFDLRRTCPRWSIGAKTGFSVNHNSNKFMTDTDWETVGSGDFVTNYSKNYCDVMGAFLFRGDVDVNISDWLNLPPSMELRPLFAFQYQRYSLMVYDGFSWDYQKGTYSVDSGNFISFRQDWYLYMIGLRGSYNLDLSKYMTIKLKGEADWGPALGYNADHHERREGDLWGFINSSGNALYFLTGVDMTVSKTITIGIGIDYLWIRTSGQLHDLNIPKGKDEWSSDDVKSWSDQLGLTAHVSFAF